MASFPGIFWFDEKENSFGSGENQDVQLPEGTIPDNAGALVYENDQVTMNVKENVVITHEGDLVSEMFLFDGENEDTLHV